MCCNDTLIMWNGRPVLSRQSSCDHSVGCCRQPPKHQDVQQPWERCWLSQSNHRRCTSNWSSIATTKQAGVFANHPEQGCGGPANSLTPTLIWHVSIRRSWTKPKLSAHGPQRRKKLWWRRFSKSVLNYFINFSFSKRFSVWHFSKQKTWFIDPGTTCPKWKRRWRQNWPHGNCNTLGFGLILCNPHRRQSRWPLRVKSWSWRMRHRVPAFAKFVQNWRKIHWPCASTTPRRRMLRAGPMWCVWCTKNPNWRLGRSLLISIIKLSDLFNHGEKHKISFT